MNIENQETSEFFEIPDFLCQNHKKCNLFTIIKNETDETIFEKPSTSLSYLVSNERFELNHLDNDLNIVSAYNDKISDFNKLDSISNYSKFNGMSKSQYVYTHNNLKSKHKSKKKSTEVTALDELRQVCKPLGFEDDTSYRKHQFNIQSKVNAAQNWLAEFSTITGTQTDKRSYLFVKSPKMTKIYNETEKKRFIVFRKNSPKENKRKFSNDNICENHSLIKESICTTHCPTITTPITKSRLSSSYFKGLETSISMILQEEIDNIRVPQKPEYIKPDEKIVYKLPWWKNFIKTKKIIIPQPIDLSTFLPERKYDNIVKST